MILINELKKFDNESIEQYKQRVCSSKDDYALTWNEVAKVINSNTGLNLSADAYRKYYYFHKDDANLKINIEDNSNYIRLQKEKIKLRDERNQLNSLVRTLAREETLKEIALEVVDKLSYHKMLNPPKPERLQALRESAQENKSATLVISDWHYGLEVDVPYNKYNPEIAVERINQLLTKTVTLCKEEKISDLIILNLGDLISGNIHLPLRINNRYDVITQTINVAELLSEFIVELCENVPNVFYSSTTDNHSRIDSNKKESLQIESFVRIIDWHIKYRLKDISNFTFIENSLGQDIASYYTQGHIIAGVHGDKDKQSSIISSLTLYAQHHWDMILSAHMHHFSANESNNTLFLCNGSLVGTDEYASSLRCNSKPSQLFIVSTPENVADSIHKIDLI